MGLWDICVWTYGDVAGVFLSWVSIFLFLSKQGLSLNLEVTSLARLPGQKGAGILLSPSILPSLQSQGRPSCPAFYWRLQLRSSCLSGTNSTHWTGPLYFWRQHPPKLSRLDKNSTRISPASVSWITRPCNNWVLLIRLHTHSSQGYFILLVIYFLSI